MINFALFFWPILTIILARTLPWQNALIASLVGGYLLLPEQGGINFPLLPPLAKDTIPCMTLFLLALVMRPGAQGSPVGEGTGPLAQKGWLPRSIVGQALLGLMIAGSLLTALTNSDPLRFAETSEFIRGLRLYDGFSMIVNSTAVILPILLGRKYLADARAHRLLLIGLVGWALAYSLLALIEVRLSPQMNRWVYGFFPHSWHQHIRGSGYRPLVFLQHGLLLAIFFSMTIIAAFGLSRADPGSRTKWLMTAGWLLMTLVLCNSLGALVIAVLLVPVLLFLPLRLQLLIAGLIAVVVLFYPLMRGAGLVPTERIVGYAESYSDQRARSLQFRLNHEDTLLERANERPLFGWGPWGRNRIYDARGRDQSVVDGAWIVAIGQGGWIGYLAEFGLLSVPLILFALRRRRYDIDQATAALCLVLAANMIDMIPNSGRSPLTWLIVGALLGRLELGSAAGRVPQEETAANTGNADPGPTPSPVSPYTRQDTLHHRQRPHRKSRHAS